VRGKRTSGKRGKGKKERFPERKHHGRWGGWLKVNKGEKKTGKEKTRSGTQMLYGITRKTACWEKEGGLAVPEPALPNNTCETQPTGLPKKKAELVEQLPTGPERPGPRKPGIREKGEKGVRRSQNPK